jgi:hypothetical protein
MSFYYLFQILHLRLKYVKLSLRNFWSLCKCGFRIIDTVFDFLGQPPNMYMWPFYMLATKYTWKLYIFCMCVYVHTFLISKLIDSSNKFWSNGKYDFKWWREDRSQLCVSDDWSDELPKLTYSKIISFSTSGRWCRFFKDAKIYI